MYKLKLKKALSYAGIVTATKDKPYVTVEDEAVANAAVASGFFEIVEVNATEEPPAKFATGTITKFNVMTITQLREYAKTNNIDLGKATKKEEIVLLIEQAANGENNNPEDLFIDGNEGNPAG